jgi:uncharacterized phiE125 gp8 family phage protein
MKHITKTPPALYPVSLAEMRPHIGITRPEDTARDAIITGRIVSATQWCEQYTRSAFVTQTWTGYADRFPDEIRLRGPLLAVQEVRYLDTSGVDQILATDQYKVDRVLMRVIPAYGLAWPDNRIEPNAVQVDYLCGYGEPGCTAAESVVAVPETIKDAIRFIVGQWEQFQSSIEGVVRPFTIPNAAKQLLEPYIDYREIP